MDKDVKPRETHPEMTVVCAWCDKVLQFVPDAQVSHGICRKCARQMSDEAREAMNDAHSK